MVACNLGDFIGELIHAQRVRPILFDCRTALQPLTLGLHSSPYLSCVTAPSSPCLAQVNATMEDLEALFPPRPIGAGAGSSGAMDSDSESARSAYGCLN